MTKSFPVPSPNKRKISRPPARDSYKAAVRRIFLFVVAIAFGGFSSLAISDGQFRFENFLYAQISQPMAETSYAVSEKPARPDLDLEAKSAFSMRIGATGRERIIFKKNSADVLPIASITKLMTATLVLENKDIYSLNASVPISREAALQDDVPVYGNLKVGEVYTVRQLLNLMLFYSSNDAAYALSEVMGVDKFVALMNQKAKDLGLENTVFYNPSGLDGNDGTANNSTAVELMALVKYLLESHPDIFSFTISPVASLTENGIFNINLWDGQRLIGGKTGYTEKAGGCMIIIFENENHRRYINILLGSASSETRVAEMQKMINFANNYDRPAAN